MPQRLTVVGLSIVALVAHTPAVRTAPGPLHSSVSLTVDGSFKVNAAGNALIKSGLIAAFDFARNKSQWRCFESPGASASKGLTIEVTIDKNGTHEGDATVNARLLYDGNPIGVAHIPVGKTMIEDEETRPGVLKEQAVRALNDALDNPTSHPCDPKAKIKGKTTMDMQVPQGKMHSEATIEGQGTLPILADGSFSATIPLVQHNLGATLTAKGMACTYQPSEMQYQLVASGNYDDADGTLKFVHMITRNIGGMTGQGVCVADGHTLKAPSTPVPQAPSEDMAQSMDLRIALEDHANLTVPIQSYRYVTQELSIDLSFGGAASSAPTAWPHTVLSHPWLPARERR